VRVQRRARTNVDAPASWDWVQVCTVLGADAPGVDLRVQTIATTDR
jgi:hypothetical protein